jgi:hypothetical protein
MLAKSINISSNLFYHLKKRLALLIQLPPLLKITKAIDNSIVEDRKIERIIIVADIQGYYIG